MEKVVKELNEKFIKIKNNDLNKSLREGYTGLGYTFESLIGKSEDRMYFPDYKGIEIKTKLGYSKSPLTLFCMSPQKNGNTCAEELLKKYGYPKKNYKKLKSFGGSAYQNERNIIANKYFFKTKLDFKNKKLKIIIVDINLRVLEDSIYWDLNEIKDRLYTKLKILALVNGYPYKRNGDVYYKYTNIKFYKLKGFYVFLKLLKEDKVFITFNIGTFTDARRYGIIHDRGTAFRIKIDSIEELFVPINVK